MFEKIKLPYPFSGLEPYIDTKTMMVHYERHYGAYVDNLNKYIAENPALAGLSLEDLLRNYPDDEQIRHNAGGVFNHEFFFTGMRPGARSQIIIGLSGKLLQSINRDFGSLEEMKNQFSAAANGVFGSGYAWLVAYPNKKLAIITTENQDTPIQMGLKPLLCIDVWEHAYYLKHLNLRADYVRDFWYLVDWVRVAERLG
ncbi:MAG: superoxide dismutase [Christensenellaceae bacterium]|nr:superoxide dismutase [Christensenellaceae bacterium]